MKHPPSERVLDVLEWKAILAELDSRCATEPGKKVTGKLSPLAAAEIKKQLAKITEMKEAIGQGIEPDFSGITDIEDSVNLASKGGILKPADLFAVRNLIIASGRMRDFIHRHREEMAALTGERDRLDRLAAVGDLLISSFTDSGELSQAKYPGLKRIRDEIYRAKQDIERQLLGLIHSPDMEKIVQEKVFSTRNERYVILVRAGMKGKHRGTVLDISSSGQTLYMEPEGIVPMNNRLLGLVTDLQIEINRILRDLSAAVGGSSEEILNNLRVLAYVDYLAAAARFSIAVRGSAPMISASPVVKLYSARHPLLYLINPEAIPNDIYLGIDFNCLIISGANTGGKTVLLKTIGLCAMMVLFGLHVPAGPDSEMGIFSEILADIGDDQNLAASLSTYSGQIVIIREMLERAGRDSLILIDEIIVGTNPRQGATLAQAILEKLALTDARIVVTTHYSELKDLVTADRRFQNASVSFDLDTLKPTYRLRTGIPGVSYTLEIAKTYGIPETILARSRELLDGRELSAEALIERIQKHEQEVEDERRRNTEIREELSRETRALHEAEQKLKRQAEDIKRERGIAFLEELKNYSGEIASRIRDLQQAGLKQAAEAQKDIAAMRELVSDSLKKSARELHEERLAPFDPAGAKPGDAVFIISLEKEGKLESLDLSGGTALVLFGRSIRTRFRFDDLLAAGGGERKARPAVKQKKPRHEEKPREPLQALTVQTSHNTVDLRGLTVDEALEKMESGFDRMGRGGIRSAVVIHGHGTGALKEAMRARLRVSPYVVDFRPGGYGEGGDGVTIVRLRD